VSDETPESLIPYDEIVQDALRAVVGRVLGEVEQSGGLPGGHHFYITFKTKAPGVSIPKHLAERFPDEMTIVIQHRFWDLKVESDTFSVGLRGAVGGIISCGQAPTFAKATVLVGGPAYRVPMQALEDAKRRSAFIGNIFCRFSDYLLAQVMESVACNAFHSIPERAARWLLHAQDRSGDRIELTQEALAKLLGVQRTTVNAVVRELLDAGLISTGRGVIRVTDRAGLKRRACECYQRLEDHFGAIIGSSGTGG
jgi:DNA-binding transcriptional regulator YhcF (GntR family)